VVRAVTGALTARGINPSAIDAKAYWRRGGANASVLARSLVRPRPG
jgi:hypothetical protein